MRYTGQRSQIEFLIEVPVDMFEHAVHARRVFSLASFLSQSTFCRLS
jgi:hypothetical protein